MSSTIKEIHAKLSVSKPIFIGEIDTDGEGIRFKLMDSAKYEPSEEGITDPVELEVINCFRESFDTSSKTFKKDENFRGVYLNIFSKLLKIYEHNSPLKNPIQSKLYKWLYSVSRRDEAPWSEGIIVLYRYAQPFCGAHIRFDEKNKQHAANVIAILEKIRDKYEQ